MSFRREFVFQLSRKLIGFCVVVPLAFLLQNHWALVAGTLASKLAATVISYLMHPFRPRLSLKRIGQLFRFSKWILLHNVVAFCTRALFRLLRRTHVRRRDVGHIQHQL